MKRCLLVCIVVFISSLNVPLFAQTQTVPELNFDSQPNFLKLPADIYLGEAAGVAQNSKGHIFVFTRSGETQLFEFDQEGNYVREISPRNYAFAFAHTVRVDPQDNVWVVDQMTNMVMKFDKQGRQVMLLGRKAESINIPARPAAAGGGEGGGGAAGAPGAGRAQDIFDRPTDVAWDAQGNIFVADGQGNARVAKFDKDGKFVKSWGQKGSGQGQFDNVRSIAVNAQGDVYVADGNNHRIQIFDNNGTFKSQIGNLGNPQAICMTSGANPMLYVSNSNPPNDIDKAGEIYKMKLDGTIVGKFGRAGKMAKEFGTVNSIDCRNENSLLVGEIGNLRVQKVTLR